MKKTVEVPFKRKPMTSSSIPPKSSGTLKTKEKDLSSNLTKKLSLALEEKLSIEDKNNDFQLDDSNINTDEVFSNSEIQRKNSVLEKAKALVFIFFENKLIMENEEI